MKKNRKQWLTMCILGILILAGILGYYVWTRSSQSYPMFTYEFEPGPPDEGSVRMSVRQEEGFQYSIIPMGEIIISEPSPDWGIEIHFTEEPSDYLYFYGSYSPGGSDYFPDGVQQTETVMIHERELRWGSFGNFIFGSYQVSDGYRIFFQLEESWWEEHQKLIIDLIESARIVYLP